jgi:heme oxygenase
MADKIAERIRRNIKNTTPWILDDVPGPIIQKMQEQIETLSKQLGDALQELAEKQLKLKGKDEMRNIDLFDAQTRRLVGEGNTIKDLASTPGLQAAIVGLIRENIQEMLGDRSLQEVEEATKPLLDQAQAEGSEAA